MIPTTLSLFDLAAALVVLATLIGYLNHRTVKLPSSVALTLAGAGASLIVIVFDRLFAAGEGAAALEAAVAAMDFRTTLLNGLLSFLLFAGALHVDLEELRQEKWSVGGLTTLGVLLSTAFVAVGFRVIMQYLGVDMPFAWCLVFGALISPTDPVAVIGCFRAARVPPKIEAAVAGESLFNDGVGVALFTILFALASNGSSISISQAALLFAREAIGGVLFGLLAGWVAYRALKSIDEHNIEVMITLALVMGGYAVSDRLGVSGPIAMAAAGLLIGNIGRRDAMSENTRDYMQKFWSLLDEILNSVLFLLIGVEVVLVPHTSQLIIAGLLAIPLGFAARAASIAIPMAILTRLSSLPWRAFPLLLLGGLRGGISFAMALSLPEGPVKNVILVATYALVLFSVIFQSLAVGPTAKWLFGANE